ncbi:MAG TPA: hypothetical protein ENI19_02105 [Candidatus Nealsonbacteria bacterium]|uniref:Phage holin family protein n=1 Tax=marine sediment metagenome TaxID=412755 RepID=A0A0F9UWG6_9ZZZZ|nr:hypothetical protein [Candidatus Nealsonbacteria bacterium]HEB46481.1 hypothetical protein [Candidatus Nealsonbacteria bacterium]
MRELILQIVSGILGLWLVIQFIPRVEFVGENKYLLLAGLILGLLNFFLKPILNFITLPLRLLTFGLFSLIINMLIIWTVDLIFFELTIPLIIPLLWTTLVIWGLGFVVSILFPKPKKSFLK